MFVFYSCSVVSLTPLILFVFNNPAFVFLVFLKSKRMRFFLFGNNGRFIFFALLCSLDIIMVSDASVIINAFVIRN